MTTATAANGGELGIAVQVSEGTGIANPKYTHPIYGGLPMPNESIKAMDITATTSVIPGYYKTQTWGEFDTTFPALPLSIGMWLQAFMGVDVVAPVGTHTFTFSDAAQLFYTVFGKRPGTPIYTRLVDTTITDLNFLFTAGEVLKCNVKGKAYTATEVAAYTPPSATTSTAAELMSTPGPFYDLNGSTLKLNVDSTPAAATVTNIISGAINLSRAVNLIQTNAQSPGTRVIGQFGGGLTLKVVWTDYQAYLATYYGSKTAANATAQSPVMVKGSFSGLFQVAPTVSATQTLTLNLPSVFIRVPAPPDVDVTAGPLEMDLAGVFEAPSSGAVASAVLLSPQLTYQT